MSDKPAYPAAVAALAAQIPAKVTVPSDALAHFDTSITSTDALDDGSAIESVSVLDEVLRVGGIAMTPVLDGKVIGYGRLRMRYFLDRAAELASKVSDLDTSRVASKGAGTAKTMTLRDSRALRTRAIRVLKNLAGRRPEEKARLARAGKGTEKADERARSLDALARELEDAMSKVPASVAADAGATRALVDALLHAGGAVLGTRGEAQDARSTVASLYDEMNLLDGRLLHELRLLIGAMRDARKEDKTVPAVKSSLFRSGKRKKAAGAAGNAEGGGTSGGG
jgi:hypothetical protein